MSDDADKLAAEYHLSNGPAGKLARVYQEARREIERLKEPKWFPIQNSGFAARDSRPGPARVPWAVGEKAYDAYARIYGKSQSMERMAERGGFSLGEMDEFYPAWREAVDAVLAWQQRATAAESALAALREQAERDAKVVAAATQLHWAEVSSAELYDYGDVQRIYVNEGDWSEFVVALAARAKEPGHGS